MSESDPHEDSDGLTHGPPASRAESGFDLMVSESGSKLCLCICPSLYLECSSLSSLLGSPFLILKVSAQVAFPQA